MPGVAAPAAPATASLAALSISSFSPATGAAGTSVTITWSNFKGVASAFTVTSPSKITAAVPATPSSAEAGPRLSAGARAAAVGGTWRTAREVPGTAALNQGGYAVADPVSCRSAGSCGARGF